MSEPKNLKRKLDEGEGEKVVEESSSTKKAKTNESKNDESKNETRYEIVTSVNDSKYIDGFILPVDKTKREEYKKVARFCGKIFIEHGALEYFESRGDDLDMSFGNAKFQDSLSIDTNKNDIIFAFCVFESKSERDRINASVMSDSRMNSIPQDLFDMKRMLWGGFSELVNWTRGRPKDSK